MIPRRPTAVASEYHSDRWLVAWPNIMTTTLFAKGMVKCYRKYGKSRKIAIYCYFYKMLMICEAATYILKIILYYKVMEHEPFLTDKHL